MRNDEFGHGLFDGKIGPAPRDCAGRRLPLCFLTVRLQRTERVDWDEMKNGAPPETCTLPSTLEA